MNNKYLYQLIVLLAFLILMTDFYSTLRALNVETREVKIVDYERLDLLGARQKADTEFFYFEKVNSDIKPKPAKPKAITQSAKLKAENENEDFLDDDLVRLFAITKEKGDFMAFISLQSSTTKKARSLKVKIGDSVNNYSVTGIFENHITFKKQNKTIELKLFGQKS